MPERIFNFKNFKISHSECAMKVGTDGVLLGLFANHKKPEEILDIGTGTGLISLMLNQRFPKARITAIEPVKKCSEEAISNIKNAGKEDFIKVDIARLQDYLPKNTFDLIVCNPPFFKAVNETPSDRNLARMKLDLTTEEIFTFANKFLNANGLLWLILPSIDEEEYRINANNFSLFLNTRINVAGYYALEPKRLITSFSKKKNPNPILNSLCIETRNRGNWTMDFRKKAKNFYLKL